MMFQKQFFFTFSTFQTVFPPRGQSNKTFYTVTPMCVPESSGKIGRNMSRTYCVPNLLFVFVDKEDLGSGFLLLLDS